jgi:membrane associated rhomboid family serine protease
MSGVKRGPVGDLYLVVGWLALLWAIFIVDIVLRAVFNIWIAGWLGLHPRKVDGLYGIVTSHFLHANLAHIASNSVGLLLLGWLSCKYSRSLTLVAILYSMLIAGCLTWLFGSWSLPPGSQPPVHVGASGVIFGLIGWLVANGLFRREWRSFFIALLVVVFYGGALPGVLPSDDPTMAQISWEMHLGGFIGGVLASWHMRKEKA